MLNKTVDTTALCASYEWLCEKYNSPDAEFIIRSFIFSSLFYRSLIKSFFVSCSTSIAQFSINAQRRLGADGSINELLNALYGMGCPLINPGSYDFVQLVQITYPPIQEVLDAARTRGVSDEYLLSSARICVESLFSQWEEESYSIHCAEQLDAAKLRIITVICSLDKNSEEVSQKTSLPIQLLPDIAEPTTREIMVFESSPEFLAIMESVIADDGHTLEGEGTAQANIEKVASYEKTLGGQTKVLGDEKSIPEPLRSHVNADPPSRFYCTSETDREFWEINYLIPIFGTLADILESIWRYTYVSIISEYEKSHKISVSKRVRGAVLRQTQEKLDIWDGDDIDDGLLEKHLLQIARVPATPHTNKGTA